MNKLNSQYLKVVYKGLIDQKSIRDINKDIRKITIQQKNDGLPFNIKQEKYCDKLVKKAKVKLNDSKIEPTLDLASQIALIVYNVFKKEDAYQQMKTFSYEYAKKEETKLKEKTINDSINDSFDYLKKIDWGNKKKAEEQVEKAKIFYLASSHDDCAVDHLDWQGKIYIDENWKKLIKNIEYKQKIQNYIDDQKIKVFQWVIGKPVWFITRPNCRHYFKKLSVQEVLTINTSTLIDKYKMHRKIGSKDQQTLYHSTNKSWYTKENIENIIEKYEERLSYHKSLYDVQKNDELKKEMEKDRLLIKKWKSYLQNRK